MLEKAIKQLSKLPRKEADKISEHIDKLEEDPYPQGCKKLQGYDDVYRIRQGDYRVLYQVFEARLIVQVIKNWRPERHLQEITLSSTPQSLGFSKAQLPHPHLQKLQRGIRLHLHGHAGRH